MQRIATGSAGAAHDSAMDIGRKDAFRRAVSGRLPAGVERIFSWNDSSRGAMNALLSGLYTNAEGKTYYTSGVGTVICRAKLSEDGLKATLTPGTVTSAGKPATFYCIRWYGRYTNSSGSRSGASIGDATDLPNTMTKK